MANVAIIVAAGRGSRAGEGVPKQYRPLNGRPVLSHSLMIFAQAPDIDAVLPVIHPADAALFAACIEPLEPALRKKILPPASGGATRQESVAKGLAALRRIARADDLVLIHDAARPYVSPDLIARAIAAGTGSGAAIPGIAVTDTIKRVDDDGCVVETPARAGLRAVQTPQVFRFSLLAHAHEQAVAGQRSDFTDDAALVEWSGARVLVFDGDAGNIKMTYPEDFAVSPRSAPERRVSRVAGGFDVHKFGPGNHIWLGGIRIPHGAGVVAHSDGDVVLHALTDAVLGLIADGDIGMHFPPSDPKWRDASSDRFLAFAVERLRTQGGMIDLMDVTILAESPRIGPHRDAMRARIAQIADIPQGRVSIKATTTETLGFTGRREGIAAQAFVSARFPEADE